MEFSRQRLADIWQSMLGDSGRRKPGEPGVPGAHETANVTAPAKTLAILHKRSAPAGESQHMVSLIAQDLEAMGIDVVHLEDTETFVPADALLVHIDRSVLPEAVTRFAAQYPKHVNGGALDIRKSRFADGLLAPGDSWPGPVIVKSDLNYGGMPEFWDLNVMERGWQRIGRILSGDRTIRILSKEDYRIFPKLADMPADYFGPGNIVQKFLPEKDGDKNILREYFFLGDVHFENVERSANAIIDEDEHVSCLPFTPHPRLLEARRKLSLDFGKIDYVMVDGEPFIFDANKTPGLGNGDYFQTHNRHMLKKFAEELSQIINPVV